MIVVATLVLCSCSSQEGIDVDYTDEKVVEWISPDGVHYWFYKSHYKMALAPRYDRNGELVIDEPVN